MFTMNIELEFKIGQKVQVKYGWPGHYHYCYAKQTDKCGAQGLLIFNLQETTTKLLQIPYAKP